MTRTGQKDVDATEREKARERAHRDDPTRQTERQIDDNQDDLGRDANDPRRVGNEINRTGH